jgi:hypothetical protein
MAADQSSNCRGIREGEKMELEVARREPWLLDLANLPFNFSFFFNRCVSGSTFNYLLHWRILFYHC